MKDSIMVDGLAKAKRRVVEEPEDVRARLALARLHRDRRETALALEQLESARELAGEDLDVLLELASAYAASGDGPAAERELRRVLRLDPDRAEARSQLGIILFKRGLYRQAEVELRHAIDLDDRSGEAYFYLGETLNQVGHVDEALEMLERAVQYQPANAKAYYTMGILYDRKHLRQEAATMYRKAREVSAA